jgi:outer membrane protein assembly factor BamB
MTWNAQNKMIGILLLGCATLHADNWPQWRGPGLDGVSKESNLPSSWSTTDNVTWKLAMPDVSGATPVIWGDHLFLNIAEGGNLYLWNVDRNSGQPRWKQLLGGGDTKVRKGNMSSPSPVTDGKTVWVMTGNGVVKSFDFTGKMLWERNLWKDYGQWGLNHGYGSSPLLFRDGLYIQVLHGFKTDDPSYLLRLDAKTGRTVWKVERPTDAIVESPDSYTTPTIAYPGGKAELIITGGDYITGHDLDSGKELWRGAGMNPRNNPMNRIIASPLAANGLVYVPTRVNPLQAYRPGGKGTVTESHLVWSTPNGPDVPTPVSDGKLLYIINDRGIVYCFDALTGKEVYGGQRIKPAIYSSSPVLADGKIYMSNEDGLTTVIKAGPVFEVLAENALDDYLLSSPAISDGQIFIRTKSYLYAIGKRVKK